MRLTTHDMLRAGGSIAWALFDRDWYLRIYPEVAGQVLTQDFDDVLDFYLRYGQARGHSPNPFFDEAWYLRTYPAIADQVRAGAFASGFDHYCHVGYQHHSPHWLFDVDYYRLNNPDLTDATLQVSGHRDHYNHYLISGIWDGRIAHRFFSPKYYLAQPGIAADVEAGSATGAVGGAFGHYLRSPGMGAGEARTTPYFDPQWYRSAYPQVTEAIGKGEWRCALHHYLANPAPGLFDPLAEFSEKFYLTRYPDVATAIAEGQFSGRGYWHFLTHGVQELRAPSSGVDLNYYRDQHASVRTALAERTVADAFVHLLTIGRADGLRSLPPVDEPPDEPQAKALFRLGAINLVPALARTGIDFSFTGLPDVSVIMVVHDQFALTLRALSSVRQNFAGAIELILVDGGSTDETRHIRRYVRGARIVSFATNIGYLRGCNAALNFVTAEYVLYLNNDIELGPSAISAALRRLRSEPTVGAVGGKVIRTHGRLQEAGCIVWRDGSTQGYLRDASPQAPEANFVRDVDFCSAVFLLVRTGLARELGGFDDSYAPAYFEDADFCVRLIASGYRIVYDPAVVVQHLEYGSSANSLEAETQMARSHQIFRVKHAAWLNDRMAPAPANQLWARSTAAGPKGRRGARRVLFIEDVPPIRLIGSGYVRSNDLVSVMVDLGLQVTVFPVEHRQFELAAVFADLPESVEVMHDRTIEDLPTFLADRAGYYDVVWIGRTHNLDRTVAMLTALADADGAMPRLILDTEAVAALRDAAQTRLRSIGQTDSGEVGHQAQPFDLDAALTMELANAPLCDRVIAVSESEAALLRRFGLPNVSVIGHLAEIKETDRPWKDRAGMLFVGAIHAMDSPNYDSLCWFADEVLPLVERELGWQTRLTIVGYTAPSVDLSRFANHARITLRGALADLEPVYNQHLVFVAPTRFAAGIPYKVHSAAAHGLPVIATPILQQQLAWQDGEEILVAADTDPASFARHIVDLSRSEQKWQAIRSGAFARLRAENGRAGYTRALREAVFGA